MKNNLTALSVCFFSIFLSLVFSIPGFCKETMIWPYICYKPIYICQGNQLVGGIGFNVINQIQKELPDYEHKTMLMPVKRILEFAKQGEHQIFYGFYKTPEREKFLRYSLPCRISIPTFIVIRKTDYHLFNNGKPISLKKLLKTQEHTFLAFKSISFGKGIDELLYDLDKKENITTLDDTTEMGPKSLKMLINNRVDFFLSLDSTVYDIRQLNLTDKVAYLPIIEQSTYETGYITAPKNAWGDKIINQVNKVLRKIVVTDEFFNFFKPLVNQDMVPSLKAEFEKKIIQPSRLRD